MIQNITRYTAGNDIHLDKEEQLGDIHGANFILRVKGTELRANHFEIAEIRDVIDMYMKEPL